MKCSVGSSWEKGQAEFVVVAALVIVGVVAVILATQPGIVVIPTAPTDILLEQELISDSVGVVTRAAAQDTLRVVENHGGYLTPGIYEEGEVVPFEVFLSNGVPIAQMCDEVTIPSKALVENLIEIGIERYVRGNIESILGASDRQVIVNSNELRIDANILDDRVIITINLPTSVEGYAIPQPYPEIIIETNLGRIIDFQNDFVTEMASNRPFEIFTIYTIQHSRHLYHDGVLTTCGEGLEVSGAEINLGLERAVRAAMHPAMWTPMVDQTSGDLADVPKILTIQNVNGRVYSDLENIRFDLPDGWVVYGSEGIDIDNDEVALYVPGLAPPLETTDVCIQTYHNAYGINYPVIVSVFDEATKYWYRFAIIVDVDASSGPSGIDADVLIQGLMDSFDQRMQEAGLNDFGLQLQTEALNQGVQLTEDEINQVNVGYTRDLSELRQALMNNVENFASTEAVGMGLGNCEFN